MSTLEPLPAALDMASQAVTEYATVAFQSEFLCWDKIVNLAVAELVWNAYSVGVDPPRAEPPGSQLAELYERLIEVRRLRWGDQLFLVFGLAVREEEGRIFFTFDLTWDGGRTSHPCQIEWIMQVAEPASQQSPTGGGAFANLS